MVQTNANLQHLTIAGLEEVKRYQNKHVIDRFRESWDVSPEQGQEIFDEMLTWLWLCASSVKHRKEGRNIPKLSVTRSMTLLDEMWHAFILFTKPYTAFCQEHFGFYIHHGPTTNDEKDAAKEKIQNNANEFLGNLEKDLTLQYEYIYDQLGENTLKKWYSEWTDLYTTEQLNKLYKKHW